MSPNICLSNICLSNTFGFCRVETSGCDMRCLILKQYLGTLCCVLTQYRDICNLNYKISDYGCDKCTFYHSVTRYTLLMTMEDDFLMMAEIVSRNL
jgi:hypothetical protein